MVSFGEFEKGIEQVIKEFHLKSPKVDKNKFETPEIGNDYIAEIETDDVIISLHVRTKVRTENKRDWKLMYAFYYKGRLFCV